MSKKGVKDLTIIRQFDYARTVVIVVVFSGMFLAGCAKDKISQHNDIIGSWYPKVLALYALEDIPDGQKLSAPLLEEREVALNKIPQDAFSGGTIRAAGRITKFRILAGQIIRYHDLIPENGSEENIILLSKEDQEKLEKKAAQNHKSTSELIKAWIYEHLKN